MKNQTQDKRIRISLRLQTGLMAIALLLLVSGALGQAIQIDPYPLDGSGGQSRCIPDIVNSGEYVLPWNNVIDIIILGDGYLPNEHDTFLGDARIWYKALFGSCRAPCGTDPPCSNAGIIPYTYFPQAFRVRAFFQSSTERASADRDSFYGVEIDGDGDVSNSGWWDDNEFRHLLYTSMESVMNPPFNHNRYPPDLEATVPGDPKPIIHNEIANMYSHTVVVMLVRASCGDPNGCKPSGRTRRVVNPFYLPPTELYTVNVAFARNEKHEFGHAFAYLEDEYISERGRSSDRNNPQPQDRSIFLLSNLTYNNYRCNQPWAHLAPGGIYNPDPDSLLGNFYRGGEDDTGVWHSEYWCLMNGEHENYTCDLTGDYTRLRDYNRLCFWCEEIVTLRILMLTGQLPCSLGDMNECGRYWYSLWEGSVRDLYYTDPRFNIISRIADRSACYVHEVPCDGYCDGCPLPTCLSDCQIRDPGNAVYVDSTSNLQVENGSRLWPYRSLYEGVANVCGPHRTVLIRPGSYPGSYTISDHVRLTTSSCTPVRLGE